MYGLQLFQDLFGFELTALRQDLHLLSHFPTFMTRYLSCPTRSDQEGAFWANLMSNAGSQALVG